MYIKSLKKSLSSIIVNCGVGTGILLGPGAIGRVIAAESLRDFEEKTFSNVRLIKAENDLVGWRIQFIKGANNLYVLVQSFEGSPQAPCLSKAQVNISKEVQFELPPNCDFQGRFSGKIYKGSLVGGFSNGMTGPNGESTMTLKRVFAK